MKKLKAYLMPLAVLLLLGFACTQKRSKKAAIDLPGCCTTDSNLTFVNVDSLHGKRRYDLVMKWEERLLAFYTTHYDGYPVCEVLIGLWPEDDEETNYKATRKIVFFGSKGQWSSVAGNKFTYEDGSILEIGLYYPGPDRVLECPKPPKPDTKLPSSPEVKNFKH